MRWHSASVGEWIVSWNLCGLGSLISGLGSSRQSCGCKERGCKLGLYVYDQEVLEFVVAPDFRVVRWVGGKRVGSLDWQADCAFSGPEQASMNHGGESLQRKGRCGAVVLCQRGVRALVRENGQAAKLCEVGSEGGLWKEEGNLRGGGEGRGSLEVVVE